MPRQRTLLVGLEPEEIDAIRNQIGDLLVAHSTLPRVRLVEGELFAESSTQANRFLKIDKVVYHGIFENDFHFLTLLALWGGHCLPDAQGMMDCRLRHSGLVRAARVSRFGKMKRGMSLEPETWTSNSNIVAKWGDWHCGENKHRFEGEWQTEYPTVFEPFIEGEAVRIMLIGEQFWQIRLTGDAWLKSIHHSDAAEMPVDAELLADARVLAEHFKLPTVGIDYMIGNDGQKYLLEVNHIPNVTVFPFVREAYISYTSQWVNALSPEDI